MILTRHELLEALDKAENELSSIGSEETAKVLVGSCGEVDPTGRNPHELGAKLDAGKPCLFRGAIDYFPRAIEQVAAISTFGASKYAWKGWITVPDGITRYSDAMVRHLIAEGKGELLDRDSGLRHAAHAAWGALARLELMLRNDENTRSSD